SRRRHTRSKRDWSSDVCSSDLQVAGPRNAQLHSQPANALLAATQRSGWETSDLDFIEINEAFGAVVVQSLKELGDYPLEKTNLRSEERRVGKKGRAQWRQ